MQGEGRPELRIRRLEDAKRFQERAEPFLLEREAENNLMLGIPREVARDPADSPANAFFAVVERDGRIVGAALRTPPLNVVLSFGMPLAVTPLLAREVRSTYGTLPGVLATPRVAQAFARQWTRLTGQGHRPGMSQRIYRLARVIPVTGVQGRLRHAGEGDRELLRAWLIAFQREALPDQPLDEDAVARNVDSRFGSGERGIVLWCNPEPVSMAGFGGMTPNGVRIGAVYTPPEHRRRGYASACVAALSQLLLGRGRRYCFLFTDLANPTSNRIYRQIGYEPVSDVQEMRFEAR
jgi:predicted GNAT family acetyltransferase